MPSIFDRTLDQIIEEYDNAERRAVEQVRRDYLELFTHLLTQVAEDDWDSRMYITWILRKLHKQLGIPYPPNLDRRRELGRERTRRYRERKRSTSA